MSAPAIFARRTVVWLVVVGGLSFAAALVLTVVGEDLFPSSTVEANAYSQSAIGYKAFVETLQQLGTRVLVSRSDSLAKAAPDDLIVVAEPPPSRADDEYFNKLLEAEHVLLVLPKWDAVASFTDRHWAGFVLRLPEGSVERILRRAVPDGGVVALDKPVKWDATLFGAAPTLDAPQLIRSQQLLPIIADDQGTLLGYMQIRKSNGLLRELWVLADPDLLSNVGLRRGQNAVLAVALVDRLRRLSGAVIVDEVIHGFRHDPNLWRTMFEFPFIFVTLNALAALIVLVWAAMGRFGAPLPVSAPLKAGKTTLIGNAAGLLSYGGHAGAMLRRYLAVTVGDVAQRVHAPAQLNEAALFDWLERIGRTRQVQMTPTALRRDAEGAAAGRHPDARRLLQAARNLYRWKQEMLHGPGDDSSGRRTSETGSAQGGRRPGGGH